MPSTPYDLVQDDQDLRVPLHADQAFLNGITFQAKRDGNGAGAHDANEDDNDAAVFLASASASAALPTSSSSSPSPSSYL
ncbi:hypothetical protein DOY81_001246 [Sarcophaga bullata]|nr:hypothetical protein DOY81_001246 [Sarcophaga bullata]